MIGEWWVGRPLHVIAVAALRLFSLDEKNAKRNGLNTRERGNEAVGGCVGCWLLGDSWLWLAAGSGGRVVARGKW